jgi:hypothetical protein
MPDREATASAAALRSQAGAPAGAFMPNPCLKRGSRQGGQNAGDDRSRR